MEKLGVEIDTDKVKEAEKKGGIGGVKPSQAPKQDPETETNVPWDPEHGTEPYEKRPEPKVRSGRFPTPTNLANRPKEAKE